MPIANSWKNSARVSPLPVLEKATRAVEAYQLPVIGLTPLRLVFLVQDNLLGQFGVPVSEPALLVVRACPLLDPILAELRFIPIENGEKCYCSYFISLGMRPLLEQLS